MGNSFKMGGRPALCCALLYGLLGVPGISHGAEPVLVVDKYELMVFQGSVGEKEIIAGQLSQAVEKIKTTSTLDSAYNAHTNLCVAYTAQKQYESAQPHCKAAVRESGVDSMGLRLGFGLPSAERERRATALSNLGVMYALRGEAALAQRYFEAAASRSKLVAEAADRNIAALASDDTAVDLAAS